MGKSAQENTKSACSPCYCGSLEEGRKREAERGRVREKEWARESVRESLVYVCVMRREILQEQELHVVCVCVCVCMSCMQSCIVF